MATVVDRAGVEMTGSLRRPAGPGRTAVGCSWVWVEELENAEFLKRRRGRGLRRSRGGGAAEGRGVRRGGAVHLGTARCSSLTLTTSKAPGSVQAGLLDVTAGPRGPLCDPRSLMAVSQPPCEVWGLETTSGHGGFPI